MVLVPHDYMCVRPCSRFGSPMRMAAAVLETGPPACVLLHACSRRHYGRELAAWNLETGKCHVFGEDSGYNRRAMLVYTGE